jgi:hypothetical protein
MKGSMLEGKSMGKVGVITNFSLILLGTFYNEENNIVYKGDYVADEMTGQV